jgi:hypothetical protein
MGGNPLSWRALARAAGIAVVAATGISGLVSLAAGPAYAITESAGCAAVNAGDWNTTEGPSAFVDISQLFAVGDTINYSVTITGPNALASLAINGAYPLYELTTSGSGSFVVTSPLTTDNFTQNQGTGGTVQWTVSCTPAGSSGSSSPGSTIAGNLGQSSHYVAHYIAGAATTSFTNDVEGEIGTLFGAGAAGGSAVAANGGSGGGGGGGAAVDTGVLGGVAGSGPATRPSLLQLAQLAQGFYEQATSGGVLSPAGDKQMAAASPGSFAFGSNRPFGAFLRASYSGIGSSQAGAQFGGDVQTYTAAADYKFTPDWIGGFAVSYEISSVNTAYNFGRLSDTGVTIGPYVAWRFDPHFVWDAMLGVGWLDYNASQNATGAPSSGSFSGNRYVAASDVTGAYAVGDLRLRPTLGLLTVFELDRGFTDSAGAQQSSSSVRIGRLHGGGEAGYDIPIPNCHIVIAPFAKALVQYDLLHDGRPVTANGALVSETTVSGVLGGGIDARFSDLILLRLESSYDTIGAQNISQWNAAAQLRVNLPF